MAGGIHSPIHPPDRTKIFLALQPNKYRAGFTTYSKHPSFLWVVPGRELSQSFDGRVLDKTPPHPSFLWVVPGRELSQSFDGRVLDKTPPHL